MAERPLRIVQINTYEGRGGAARVAWNLHHSYQQRGLYSYMAVGRKLCPDPTVLLIPNDEAKPFYTRILHGAVLQLQALNSRVRGTWRLSKILEWLGEPRRWWDIRQGVEDFHYPGVWRVLDLFPEVPDVVHCHNLHGGYFDLRVLPSLSRQVPVVLTLHDAWLLSGHCAHSLDCNRWKNGCGHCPDLTIYPAIRRDATAYNWRRKCRIFEKSRLYVATPCQWLMDKVEQSILASALVGTRVIPNGVDLSVFRPADRQAARAALSIPHDTRILLFAADGIQRNVWKDYQTMRATLAYLAQNLKQNILFIALGESGPTEQIGSAKIQFVPYQEDTRVLARYYQAADIYLHAARAETFPNTILEALACGTPVVATAVGGIPEQVDDGKTGFLVAPGDPTAMAVRTRQLLEDKLLHQKFAAEAVAHISSHFDLNKQVDDYLAWYLEIVENWQGRHRT